MSLEAANAAATIAPEQTKLRREIAFVMSNSFLDSLLLSH
jgi:hypothetical protein